MRWLCSVLLSGSSYPTTLSYRAHADVFECFHINPVQARIVCRSNGKPPAAGLHKFCHLHTSHHCGVTTLAAWRTQTCALREMPSWGNVGFVRSLFRQLEKSTIWLVTRQILVISLNRHRRMKNSTCEASSVTCENRVLRINFDLREMSMMMIMMHILHLHYEMLCKFTLQLKFT